MGIYSDHLQEAADRGRVILDQIEPALCRVAEHLVAKFSDVDLSCDSVAVYLSPNAPLSKPDALKVLAEHFPGWHQRAPEEPEHKWVSAKTAFDKMAVSITVFCRG